MRAVHDKCCQHTGNSAESCSPELARARAELSFAPLAQVSQRMMSVELAAACLGAFDGPFDNGALIRLPAEHTTPSQVLHVPVCTCCGHAHARGQWGHVKRHARVGADLRLSAKHNAGLLMASLQAAGIGAQRQRSVCSRRKAAPVPWGHGLPGRARAALQRPGAQRAQQGAGPAGRPAGQGWEPGAPVPGGPTTSALA